MTGYVGLLKVSFGADTAEFRTSTKEVSVNVKNVATDIQKLGTVIGGVLGGAAVYSVFNKFIQNTVAAEQEQRQLQAVLKSTGESAGQSLASLSAMQARLSEATTFSTNEISRAQTRLLSYQGVIEQFPNAMQAVVDMATRMGMSVEQAAETVGRALDIPSQGLTALTRQGFKFGEEEKKLVKTLESTGRTAEAQQVILNAMNSAYEGAAAAARDTFGGALSALQNTVNGLMTGGDGSLTSARDAVEELNTTLKDPAVKAAVDALTGSIITLVSWLAEAAKYPIIGAKALGEGWGAIINGYEDPRTNIQHEIDAARERLEIVQTSISAREGAWYERLLDPAGLTSYETLKKEEAELIALIGEREKAYVAVNSVLTAGTNIVDHPPASLKGFSATVGSAAAPALIDDKQLKAFENVARQWQQRLELLKAEEDAGRKLSSTEQARLKTLTEISKLAPSQQASVKALIDEVTNLERANLERSEESRILREVETAREDYIRPFEDEAKALQQQVENLGLSELAIKKNMLAKARAELATAKLISQDEGWIQTLQRRVDALESAVESMEKIESFEISDKAAKEAEEAWKRTSQTIEQSLTDALMRGFEDGKSFGKNARDALENMFKTLILRPVIQPIAQGIANTVMGAIYPGGSIAGLGSLGQTGGGFSLSNLPFGSTLGGWAGNGLIGLGSSLGVGSALGGFSTGLGAGLAGSASIGTLAQVGLAQLSGGATAMGLGTLLSAALPVIGAIGAIASIAGLFGSKSTPHTGAVIGSSGSNTITPYSLEDIQSQYTNPGNAVIFGESDFFKRRNQGVADALTPLAQGFAQALNSSFASLGGQGSLTAYLGFSADNDSASRGRIGVIDELGNDLYYLVEKFAKDPQAGLEGFTGRFGDALRDTLLAALPDMAEWQRGILEGLDAGVELESVQTVVAQIGLIDKAAARLGVTAEQTAGFVDEADLDRVTQGFSTAYELFFSDAESVWQDAQSALAKSFEDLGVAIPKSEDEFKKLVASLDLSSEAGRALALDLLDLAPAFLDVARIIDSAYASIGQSAASTIRDIEMSLLDNRGKYEYLDQEIVGIISELETAVDPEKIQSLFEDARAKTFEAYNLLDETGQRSRADEFIARILELEALAQSRLGTPGETPAEGDSSVDAQEDAAVAQIDAASSLQSSADTLTSAAQEIAAAAAALSRAVASSFEGARYV